jgi:hypothetical protein
MFFYAATDDILPSATFQIQEHRRKEAKEQNMYFLEKKNQRAPSYFALSAPFSTEKSVSCVFFSEKLLPCLYSFLQKFAHANAKTFRPLCSAL